MLTAPFSSEVPVDAKRKHFRWDRERHRQIVDILDYWQASGWFVWPMLTMTFSCPGSTTQRSKPPENEQDDAIPATRSSVLMQKISRKFVTVVLEGSRSAVHGAR